MKLFIPFIVVVFLMSCGVKNELRINTSEEDPIHNQLTCSFGDMQWQPYNGKIGRPKYEKVIMPVKYSAFQLDENQLKQEMNAIKDLELPIITVPINGRCFQLELRPSGAMSPELAAKYPEIQSYRGFNVENRGEYASVDYDGKYIRVSVETTEGNYFIEPFELENGTFYLMFHKDDSGIPKVPFEQPIKK